MATSKEIKRAILRKENEESRKKNIGEYFVNFSRHTRPWLKELAADCKERKDFGIHPFVLADYYTKPEDKETALLVSLLINDNENVRLQVECFRQLMGDSPFEWFDSREFVGLTTGRKQNKRVDGAWVYYWEIGKLLDRFYHIRRDHGDLESAILQTMQVTRCTAYEAMTFYLSDSPNVGFYEWKLNIFLLRLFRTDGLGLGLWGQGNEKLFCPYNHDMRLFILNWFPDYNRYGSFRQAIELFGFEDSVDFFYAYLGYKELQRRKPRECSIYATKYRTWYEGGIYRKPFRWREITPSIKD